MEISAYEQLKTKYVTKVKKLADTPVGIRNGHELEKMMDYYEVNSLRELTLDQVIEYYILRMRELDE